MKYKINFINASYRRFFNSHQVEIMSTIKNCLMMGDLILREEVSKIERNIAKYCGVKYGVGVNSGTDAIFLSLKALGVGPGDEVITVGNAFIAMIQAIVHTGATPILVDVGEDGLMGVGCFERAITKKTKAVIPVHLSGKVCSEQIIKIAENKKIYVVEDACQALGAKYESGAMAGSLGSVGCFSFNTPKLLGAYGDGGMVVTNDKKLFSKLCLLRNHWNIYQGSVRKEDFPQPKEMGWGFKSRLDNIQAAVLNVKFKYYPKMLKKRAEIAERYNEAFDVTEIGFDLPWQQPNQVYQEYIIEFPTPKERIKFCEHMQKEGIELLVRDTTPNHKLKGLGLEHFSLPVTEEKALIQARLPIYPELQWHEVEKIIKAAKKFYAKK